MRVAPLSLSSTQAEPELEDFIVLDAVGGLSIALAVLSIALLIALATLAHLCWKRRRVRSVHVPSKDPGGAAKHFQGEGQPVRISPVYVSLC